MIRVHRPIKAPRILTGRGVTERDALCDEFDRAPDDYTSGKEKLPINRDVYAAKSVKNALVTAQHAKCAFCESKLRHVAYGDVEHFRPKGGYQQKPDDKLSKPGYYWLAYEWTNLLFSCQICNQQGKKNVFPLANPADRAVSHHDDLAAEKSLLIDPAEVDPETYISFREEVAFPRNGRRLGKTTIDVLGLNRQALSEERRGYLARLKTLRDLRTMLRDMIASGAHPASGELDAQLEKIDKCFEACRQDEAEYAAMARAVLD